MSDIDPVVATAEKIAKMAAEKVKADVVAVAKYFGVSVGVVAAVVVAFLLGHFL